MIRVPAALPVTGKAAGATVSETGSVSDSPYAVAGTASPSR